MTKNYIESIFLKTPLGGESYLNGLPAVRFLAQGNRLPFHSAVTFLVGENGTGKSTLLEAIAVAYGFNAEGGSKNFQFSTRKTHSELWEHLTLSRAAYADDGFFLRAESFYNVASSVDELEEVDPGMLDSYGGTSLHAQSHGESFMALVEHRFGGHGLYLLDEPEAALSPSRLLDLMALIHELVKLDSQFIIATHSPILMAYPNAQIYVLAQDGIKPSAYRDTEHYRFTKHFLNAPEQVLRHLFDEGS